MPSGPDRVSFKISNTTIVAARSTSHQSGKAQSESKVPLFDSVPFVCMCLHICIIYKVRHLLSDFPSSIIMSDGLCMLMYLLLG